MNARRRGQIVLTDDIEGTSSVLTVLFDIQKMIDRGEAGKSGGEGGSGGDERERKGREW